LSFAHQNVDTYEFEPDSMPFARTPEFSTLSQAVETLRNAIEKLPANRLLKDL